MAPVPTLRSWVPGEMASAALLNSQIRGSANFFLKTPWILLTDTANQSIANNTVVLVTWGFASNIVDTDNMHPGSGGQVTIVQPGVYSLNATAVFAANATGNRTVRLDMLRGATRTVLAQSGYYASGATGQWADSETALGVDDPGVPLQAGDILEMYVFQNSGGSLNLIKNYSGSPPSISTYFSARWVAAL